MRCIDQNDDNHGVIPFHQALKMAEDAGLDLVQVSYARNQPPTCKILDYGKYKYEMSKKEKEQNKKQRESIIKTKEIKMRPCTEINDLKTKARQAAKFLADGCRVKVVVRFKKHEMRLLSTGQDKHYEFLTSVKDFLDENNMDFGFDYFSKPLQTGRNFSSIIERSGEKE